MIIAKNAAGITSAAEDASLAEVTVDALSAHGEGVGALGAYRLFVRGALPGERVRVRVGPPFSPGSGRCPGELVAILQASPGRVPAGCPYAAACGGCPLGILNPAAQADYKQARLADAVRASGFAVAPDPLIGLSGQSPARFKSIRFFEAGDGRVRSGFFAPRTHTLVPIEHCPQEPAWMSALAGETAGLPAATAVHHLLMRDCGEDQRLAVLVTAGTPPAALTDAWAATAARWQLASAAAGRLPDPSPGRSANSLVAVDLRIVHGEAAVTATCAGLRLRVDAGSFFQVNPPVAELLYGEAIEFCAAVAAPGTQALDLCCGVGPLTLLLARHFDRVTGVERVPAAVAAARDNARRNGLSAAFVRAPVQRVLPRLLSKQLRAIVADPARAGLGGDCCRELGRCRPGTRLALVSCSLTALTRDLAALRQAGFVLRRVRGFDLFPQTLHVETLSLLERS